MGDDWELEDYLAAISARIKPMVEIGVDVLGAAKVAFQALWPDTELPTSPSELAEWLGDSAGRLGEWRESAARAGADEALAFVLSWYEKIELKNLQSMRTGGKWTTEPDLIKQRKAVAYSFVPYADVHTFIEDPDAEAEAEEDVDPAAEDLDDEPAPSTADIGDAGATDPSSSAPGSGAAA